MSVENNDAAAEAMDGYLKQGLNSVQAVFNDDVVKIGHVVIASAILAVGIAWLHQEYNKADDADREKEFDAAARVANHVVQE